MSTIVYMSVSALLSVTTALAIVVRIIANPLSNVFQKQLTAQAAHPLFITTTTFGFLSLLCLIFSLPLHLLSLSPAFWTIMLTVGLLSAAGNALLVKALQLGDLSVLGPINAYKSVVSIILGIALLGEVPGWLGIAGVLCIIAGSYFVLDAGATGQWSWALLHQPEIRYRLAALVCTATEAVFIKKAVLLSSPTIAFVFWCTLGFIVSLLWVAVALRHQWRQQLALVATHRRTYLLLFLSVGLMQLSTNFAFEGIQVGYALALFQLSAVLSVLFGYRFFQETHIRRKLLGAFIMVAGAVLITLAP
ncbi:DMT family transporter [Telluribacter humicola]|uniref:DMT family transporter n=1 Tax=Telluribacter humicola TaxID=1720261 RepID=UPI001E443E2A|nr:DMT family transporter [Telluribacter humicola]